MLRRPGSRGGGLEAESLAIAAASAAASLVDRSLDLRETLASSAGVSDVGISSSLTASIRQTKRELDGYLARNARSKNNDIRIQTRNQDLDHKHEHGGPGPEPLRKEEQQQREILKEKQVQRESSQRDSPSVATGWAFFGGVCRGIIEPLVAYVDEEQQQRKLSGDGERESELLATLEKKFVKVEVPPDGNCLYSAVARGAEFREAVLRACNLNTNVDDVEALSGDVADSATGDVATTSYHRQQQRRMMLSRPHTQQSSSLQHLSHTYHQLLKNLTTTSTSSSTSPSTSPSKSSLLCNATRARRLMAKRLQAYPLCYSKEILESIRDSLRKPDPNPTDQQLRTSFEAIYNTKTSDLDPDTLCGASASERRKQQALEVYVSVHSMPGIFGEAPQIHALSDALRAPICVYVCDRATGGARLHLKFGESWYKEPAIHVALHMTKCHFYLLLPREPPGSLRRQVAARAAAGAAAAAVSTSEATAAEQKHQRMDREASSKTGSSYQQQQEQQQEQDKTARSVASNSRDRNAMRRRRDRVRVAVSWREKALGSRMEYLSVDLTQPLSSQIAGFLEQHAQLAGVDLERICVTHKPLYVLRKHGKANKRTLSTEDLLVEARTLSLEAYDELILTPAPSGSTSTLTSELGSRRRRSAQQAAPKLKTTTTTTTPKKPPTLTTTTSRPRPKTASPALYGRRSSGAYAATSLGFGGSGHGVRADRKTNVAPQPQATTTTAAPRGSSAAAAAAAGVEMMMQPVRRAWR